MTAQDPKSCPKQLTGGLICPNCKQPTGDVESQQPDVIAFRCIGGVERARTRDALMDFDPYESHWREVAATTHLAREEWQLRSAKGRLLTCGVFRTTAGLEVRCGYSGDDLIRSQYVKELAAARQIADGWKATPELKGFQE